ncbi:efflux pump [Xylona heveae TC161]|uniref:Efflux pump n=1 Tax=Xylona heveae (strain CBS 132557 / TC161) TaxID=1328760 RepID=A0A165JBZ1_XYLHT|nr:efflux pump [Xylona heveae TC161]KZF26031.1 efflux pump [Xylona heveae TC161]
MSQTSCPKDVESTQHNAKEEETAGGEVTESKPQYISGIKLWLVVASVTLIAFLMLLDMSIIVTAIPRITSDFHSLADVGWYGSAYPLANCALQPLAGKLYTHSILKYTFLAFLCIFELGSLLCGAAQSSKMLIVGRAVAGLGGSGLTNGAITILSAAAPKSQQPLLIGVMMGFGQIAIVCGPLLGGAFTQHATWRWCFYINLPIGAAAAILLLVISIPDRLTSSVDQTSPNETKNTARTILPKLDLIGFVIFAAFAVMISLALEWGGSYYSWRSSVIIGLFCGGGVALIAFAAWERHVGDSVAMIPYSVACKREVWCSCVFLGFFSGSLLIFSYYLPIYFQAVKDVSPTLSGVYMLPGILGQILMAITSGVAIGKTGYYVPWALASAIFVSIAAGLISTFHVYTSTVKWVMYQFIGGFGRGCGMQSSLHTHQPIIAIQNSLPPEQSALGISLAVFGQTFGGSLFLAFAKIVFNDGLLSGLRKYASTVNVPAVIAAGVTGFRQAVAPEQITGVLRAYSLGVDRTFYLAVGASVATFVFALGMGWKKINKSGE